MRGMLGIWDVEVVLVGRPAMGCEACTRSVDVTNIHTWCSRDMVLT